MSDALIGHISERMRWVLGMKCAIYMLSECLIWCHVGYIRCTIQLKCAFDMLSECPIWCSIRCNTGHISAPYLVHTDTIVFGWNLWTLEFPITTPVSYILLSDFHELAIHRPQKAYTKKYPIVFPLWPHSSLTQKGKESKLTLDVVLVTTLLYMSLMTPTYFIGTLCLSKTHYITFLVIAFSTAMKIMCKCFFYSLYRSITCLINGYLHQPKYFE